ncbi:MAG: two-component regulator propeller domain-containing protein, partial [Ferruginibacter sp.]
MRTTFTIIFIIVSVVFTQGQIPGRFTTYSVKDGLSQSSVHAIHRDKDGLLWIGTQDGLNSFDGNTFLTYRYNNLDTTTISDQFILKILEDKKGNLWVGTRNGLNFFNKYTRKFKRYYINQEEKHQFQSSYEKLFLINDDSLLIDNQGLFLLETKSGKYTKIIPPDLKPGKWIIGSLNKVYFINNDNHVFYSKDWRKGKFIKLGESEVNM